MEEIMSRDPEKDAAKTAATKQKILETSFRIFAEKTIEKVSMTDVANEAGLGVATLYRHYSTKSLLVLAVSKWVWEQYIREAMRSLEIVEKETAAVDLEYFIDTFLELFRKNKDVLRFNQFFNIYIQNENVSREMIDPYNKMIQVLEKRFHFVYNKGEKDGTLSTGMTEKEMFLCILHLMMAAVTRYAVGLVYGEGFDPESELLLLKKCCCMNLPNR